MSVSRLGSSHRMAAHTRPFGSLREPTARLMTSSPASSSKTTHQNNDKIKASASTAQPPQRKLPRLLPAFFGTDPKSVDEALLSLKVRKMRIKQSDFDTVQTARQKIAELRRLIGPSATKQKECSARMVQAQKELQAAENSLRRMAAAAGASSSAGQQADPSEPASDSSAAAEAQALVTSLTDKLATFRKEAKQAKIEAQQVLDELATLEERLVEITVRWPNAVHPEVPIGDESNAVVVDLVDQANKLPPEFDALKAAWKRGELQLKDFPPGPPPDASKDHIELSRNVRQGLIDMASGVLSTGSSWPYLLGDISTLEQALTQYALNRAALANFIPVTPPDVVKTALADRCGFRPRDEKAKQTYFIESDHAGKMSDLCLAATAEIPLAGVLAGVEFPAAGSKGSGQLIGGSSLPIRLAALGHAFRAEAGARGADTRGLYRVHQFTKIELFMATSQADSDAALAELTTLQQDIIGGLGLPYRVLDMPTQELGASAYRKFDIEVWMPGRGSWGEVSSASNCTDYQATRLGIKYRPDGNAKAITAHTLNATAAAIPRLIVAILENYGVKDGKLVLPDELKPFWLGQKDGIHWVATSVQSSQKASALRRAIESVRQAAERQGTDPASMVASFLILHELTAIVPLVLLFYVLSAFGAGEAVVQWLQGEDSEAGATAAEAMQAGVLSRYVREWISEGMLRAERVGRKYGLFGFDKRSTGDSIGAPGEANIVRAVEAEAESRGGPTEAAVVQRMQLAGSFANAVAAYALVKALLPFRIGASLALAAPFSRFCFEPLKRCGRRLAPRRANTPPQA